MEFSKMFYQRIKIEKQCSNCKLSILQFKRKATGELKLYCRLCKSYEDLPEKLIKKFCKQIPKVTKREKWADCVKKERRKKKFFNKNKNDNK